MIIHGIKPLLQDGEQSGGRRELSDKEQKAMDNARTEAMERKRLEFLNKR